MSFIFASIFLLEILDNICYNVQRSGLVAQLVRAPPCHGGGREFESLLGRYSLAVMN